MSSPVVFIDRNSQLKPAGVTSNTTKDGVKECFIHEVTEDEGIHSECKKGPLEYPASPWQTEIYRGFNTGTRECLQPEVDWSFTDVLTREFQDTVYDSYWKKPLGRVADQVPNLPKGMNLEEICFGKPTLKSISAGELINPAKSYGEVVEEAVVGHEMYRRTHNDYYPGETVERNYSDPFKKNLIWGKPTPCDPQGRCIKNVFDAESNEQVLVSKILVDHRKRTKSLLGKVFAPNNNVQCLPGGHAFGKLNKRSIFGVGDLLKECDVNLNKVDLLEEFSSINTLRQHISKRQPTVSFRDINDALHCVDVNNTGSVPLDKAYQVLADFQIHPERVFFNAILKRMKYLTPEGLVEYEKMTDLLNANVLFPNVPKIEDCPRELLNFKTTNQIAYNYHCSPELFQVRENKIAGIPSGPKISMESMMSPSVFTTFGLNPRDFFISRSPKYIQTLFENVHGRELSEDDFQRLWSSAEDENGCVCVCSFWSALKSHKNMLEYKQN